MKGRTLAISRWLPLSPMGISISLVIISLIAGKFGGGFNSAMQEKIAKLNSANIKPHNSRPATRVCARTLVMHIHTYGSTVPVFQKILSCCILPRECDIGDSSLSGKELQAVNESVRDVANDCARVHHRHSAIQSPLSDGGAPHCMENVMASDTSLYFEGLHG